MIFFHVNHLYSKNARDNLDIWEEALWCRSTHFSLKPRVNLVRSNLKWIIWNSKENHDRIIVTVQFNSFIDFVYSNIGLLDNSSPFHLVTASLFVFSSSGTSEWNKISPLAHPSGYQLSINIHMRNLI